MKASYKVLKDNNIAMTCVSDDINLASSGTNIHVILVDGLETVIYLLV